MLRNIFRGLIVALLFLGIACGEKQNPPPGSDSRGGGQPGDNVSAAGEATPAPDSPEIYAEGTESPEAGELFPTVAPDPGADGETDAGGPGELFPTAALVPASAGGGEEAPAPTPERVRRELEAEEAGQLVYLTGEVAIARDGAFLEEVDFGTGVENYDLIRTEAASYAEVELSGEAFPPVTIAIEENTSFTLELARGEEKTATRFEMLGGILAFKVDKLLYEQEVEVATGLAVVGVRGTVFSISSLPSGEMLVICEEGTVECIDSGGASVAVGPGRALEKSGDEDFVKLNLGGRGAAEFRRDWWVERATLLKNDALAQVRANAAAYKQTLAEFSVQYEALMAESEILERWYAEDKAGSLGSATQQMRDKKIIIGHLFDIRRSLVKLNRVYHRLLDLKRFHDQGYGVGTLTGGESTAAFFSGLEQAGTGQKIVAVQYVMKLYDKRSIGVAMMDEFGELDGDDDFFGDMDAFFDSEDEFF